MPRTRALKFRPTPLAPPARFRKRRRVVTVVVGDGFVRCGYCGRGAALAEAAAFLLDHSACPPIAPNRD